MTTTPETWLSAPETARALGVAQRDMRSALTDRRILAVRRGEAATLTVPSLTLTDEDGKAAVLPPLRGTLTTLSDAGCSNEKAWRWLTTANGELGERPIDVLRAGRTHVMYGATATLAF